MTLKYCINSDKEHTITSNQSQYLGKEHQMIETIQPTPY